MEAEAEMDGLILMGAAIAVGIAAIIAVLTRTLGPRLSLTGGMAIVGASCLLWNGVALVGLNCKIGFIHHLLAVSIMVPFGFGFGQGLTAFAVALLVQGGAMAVVGASLYWWLRRWRREPQSGGYSPPAARPSKPTP
jgi:hypothetical protein